MTAWRSTLIDLAALVERLAAHHRATAAVVLGDAGASESVSSLLWLLGDESVDSRMGSLARQLSCDPSNITLQAAQLERLGLAERVQDERDGRQRRLRFTHAGHILFDRMLAAVETASPLARLTAGERAHLLQALSPAEAPATRPGADNSHPRK